MPSSVRIMRLQQSHLRFFPLLVANEIKLNYKNLCPREINCVVNDASFILMGFHGMLLVLPRHFQESFTLRKMKILTKVVFICSPSSDARSEATVGFHSVALRKHSMIIHHVSCMDLAERWDWGEVWKHELNAWLFIHENPPQTFPSYFYRCKKVRDCKNIFPMMENALDTVNSFACSSGSKSARSMEIYKSSEAKYNGFESVGIMSINNLGKANNVELYRLSSAHKSSTSS